MEGETAKALEGSGIKLFNIILRPGINPKNWASKITKLGLIVLVLERKVNIEDCNNDYGITFLLLLMMLFLYPLFFAVFFSFEQNKSRTCPPLPPLYIAASHRKITYTN